MRQTNVCLNRVFKVYVNFMYNLYPGGSRKLLCSRKKGVMKIERNKERKKDKKNDGRFIHGDQGDESAIRNYRMKTNGSVSSLEILIPHYI